jgi:hypothetical protein
MKKTRRHRAKTSLMSSLKRAIETVRQPPETVVRRIGKRLYDAEDQVKTLTDEIEVALAEAAYYREKTERQKTTAKEPYTFDDESNAVTRRLTRKTYLLHPSAYAILKRLYGEWKQGHPPRPYKFYVVSGYRGFFDAFQRPKTGDGKSAAKDILERKRDRVSLRMP